MSPQSLYDMVHYNMVLDITRISAGPQMVIQDRVFYIAIQFTLNIANMEPNNSVKKRLRCNNYLLRAFFFFKSLS